MARSKREYRAPGAIARLPGEKWADFDARQRQHRIENTVPKPRKRVSRAKAIASWKKNADQVDGFDRDDIGLSPDV